MPDSNPEFTALEHTVAILEEVPGGAEAIAWFSGRPHFGDAEILELRLLRKGPSMLRVAAKAGAGPNGAGPPFKHAVFAFILSDMVDVHLDGFGHQNVIGGLTLRRNPIEAEEVHGSLVGIGLALGEHEIVLEPCAGAFGSIRCTIASVEVAPVEDDQTGA
jgi:hypothetical protein